MNKIQNGKQSQGWKATPRQIWVFILLYAICQVFRNWKGIFAKFYANTPDFASQSILCSILHPLTILSSTKKVFRPIQT